MRYFPLKTAIFCIIIIPLLFTTTLIGIERYLETEHQNKIKSHIVNGYKANESSVLDSIVDLMGNYIKELSDSDLLVKKFGLGANISLTDSSGNLIYLHCNGAENSKDEDQNSRVESKKITIANGLDFDLKVSVLLRQNTLLSNIILSIYTLFSLLIFFFFYKQSILKIAKDHKSRREAISSLVKDEKEYIEKLESLKKERELLLKNLKEVKADSQEESRKASITEEGLFNEIVQLEKRLEENIALQKQKEEEIENLKNQLEKVEKKKGGSKRRKSVDALAKRFSNLYKNIEMNERAIEGLLDLDDDDMQLKAEEVIHQLNYDPLDVTVKRKVFAGKKNKTASFEVLFAYNGRLYFRNIEGNRVEILVIGTKNTQDKDMEFLHGI
ncbi:MAG: hypothetical protein HQK71_01430 [Desulfamplus sp.]|nr:hypothetical protein [Desulfamplus sp.]